MVCEGQKRIYFGLLSLTGIALRLLFYRELFLNGLKFFSYKITIIDKTKFFGPLPYPFDHQVYRFIQPGTLV